MLRLARFDLNPFSSHSDLKNDGKLTFVIKMGLSSEKNSCDVTQVIDELGALIVWNRELLRHTDCKPRLDLLARGTMEIFSTTV